MSESESETESDLQRGLIAREAGQWLVALRAFEAAIARDPNSVPALMYAADMQLGLDQHKLALESANAGLGLACSRGFRSLGLQVRALAFLGLKQYKQAEAAAREAVANDPANPANHRVHAQILWRRKRIDQAEIAINQALLLAPEQVNTLVLQAHVLKAKLQLKAALEIAARATVLAPDRSDVLTLHGQIAFALGRLDVARDMALWALSLDATNVAAIELLAVTKARSNWLMRPYWWFSYATEPRKKRTIFGLVLTVFAVSFVSNYLMPKDLIAEKTSDLIKLTIFTILMIYGFVCIGYVLLLKWRDQRQVKLRRNY
jgi:tetratricopeptide (TPR) repeat protein